MQSEQQLYYCFRWSICSHPNILRLFNSHQISDGTNNLLCLMEVD